MKEKHPMTIFRALVISSALFFHNFLLAQQQSNPFPKTEDDFWKNVQFGGGLGLGFGSDYTNISLSPSAVYNFNEYAALGLGIQYTYLKPKNYPATNLYGGSVIGLLNPIREIQLSAELEQLRVNINSNNNTGSQDYWNTGLFLGAGYRAGNATIGVRYNVLQDNTNIYGSTYMPFVRVYF